MPPAFSRGCRLPNTHIQHASARFSLPASALISIFVLATSLLTACRGDISEKPPLHGVRNMMDQPKYNPQSENRFFADERAQRPIIPGTVAVGELDEDPVLFEGKTPDGRYVMRNPLPITLPLLSRGQERYNIYCAPCHDRAGTGQGLVIKNYQPGFSPPPSFHEDRIRLMPRRRDLQHNHQRHPHNAILSPPGFAARPLGGDRLPARARAQPTRDGEGFIER